MRLLFEHFPTALLIGIVGWEISGNSLCIIAALLGGWLIDIDHIVDYFYYALRAGKRTSIKLLKNGGYFKLNGKVLVPLHSWEIVVIFCYIAWVDKSYVWSCAAASMALHLIQDQFTYRVRPTGYLFLSRAACGFNIKDFCRGKE